jgi:predicted acyltransferase
MARKRTRTRDERTDIVRGLLLLAVGAGLLAGVDNLPAMLRPAPWGGFGAGDLIIGAFPVVTGVAIAMRTSGKTTWQRLARRLAVLIGAGLVTSLAVHGLPLVWTGPLQQLAIASVVVAMLANVRRARRLAAAVALLAGHAWLLYASPLEGAGTLRPTLNAAATLDQAALGSHALHPTDPFGLGSLPIVVVLAIAGFELGSWLRARPPGPATAAALLVQAAWLTIGGLGGALLVPINRSLATVTWALLAAAATLALLGLAHVALALRAGRALAPVARVGQHGLVVAVGLHVIGGTIVGDGAAGPWRGLRDGLLEPLAGTAWVWIYVAGGAISAILLARALDRRNWRLTA